MILNKTHSSLDRYQVINESMGCYGDPDYYPTHKFCIVNGVDRGNGYQGYISITSFLKESYYPDDAKRQLFLFLKHKFYYKYLREIKSD